MGNNPTVLLIASMDTKAESANFLLNIVEANGAQVLLMDSGIRGTIEGRVDITRDEVAARAGTSLQAILDLKHEGKAIEAMAEGIKNIARKLHEQGKIQGVIGIGGSMGTSMATAAMRELPIGFPKVMISTMASGFTRPFVGSSDIMMLHSIADIAGLNNVLRKVLNSGGAAIAGMAKASMPDLIEGKPLVVMSSLGITEACSSVVRDILEEEGFEVMTFHANGIGGLCMEEVIAEGGVAGIVELALIEILDHLGGGLFDSGPDRGRKAATSGVPSVIATGCIDVYATGPLADAEKMFPNHRFHQHNAAITAVRTNEEDLDRMAVKLAELYRSPKGPFKILVPLGGFSAHDSTEGHLYEPSLPPIFASKLRSIIDENISVEGLPYHINQRAFGEAVANNLLKLINQ